MASTSKVAVGGGIAILIGGLALAFFTASSAPALKAANAKVIAKYSAIVDKSLSSGDQKAALKAAKSALAVDATNKVALEAYKKVILADAPKAVASVKVETNTETKSATPAEAAPAKPKAEEEEEMGCI